MRVNFCGRVGAVKLLSASEDVYFCADLVALSHGTRGLQFHVYQAELHSENMNIISIEAKLKNI